MSQPALLPSRKNGLSSGVTPIPVTSRLKAAGLGLAGVFLATGILAGCGSRGGTGDSKTMQLGKQPISCINYNSAQILQALAGMPAGFIDEASFRVGSVERVKNHLAGVPRPYLEWLFSLRAQNGFHIAERKLGPIEGPGVTFGITLRDKSSLVPSLIRITTRPDAVDDALVHEIGHAVESRVRAANKSFANDILAAFNAEKYHEEINPYPRESGVGEYFAEAFTNFYCSKDAQRFIATDFPKTYQILKASLLPATFGSLDPKVTQVVGVTGAGVRPSVGAINAR